MSRVGNNIRLNHVAGRESVETIPDTDSTDFQGNNPNPIFVFGLAGLVGLVFFTFGYVLGRNSVPRTPSVAATALAAVPPPAVVFELPPSPVAEPETPQPQVQSTSAYSVESFTNSFSPEPSSDSSSAPVGETVEETVYVTNSGSKYHRAGCRYLSKSSIPTPLSEAAGSYSPCSVCHPPLLADKHSESSRSVSTHTPRTYTPAPSETVDRNPYGQSATGHTATGIPIFTGPRGGRYHYSKSGKKVYERKK
jgi:hypothetical protein